MAVVKGELPSASTCQRDIEDQEVGSNLRSRVRVARHVPHDHEGDELGSSAQFGLATADPLPRRLRSRKLRRSLQAASKADLA